MSRVVEYDSDEVQVIISGLPITDLRAETFVTIAQRNDRYTEDEGADGGVVRNSTHSKLYDITLTLLGGSNGNNILSALAIADAAQTNGAGVVSFMIKDGNGSTLYATDKCWIKKLPDAGFGMSREDVAWELVCVFEPTSAFLGSNG